DTVRPELGVEATLALRDLNVGETHAHYAADAAAAVLNVSAQLSAPGKAPVGLNLDARLEGTTATGTVGLNSLRLKLGESGFLASGSWNLGQQAGEIRLREIAVRPQAVHAIAPD